MSIQNFDQFMYTLPWHHPQYFAGVDHMAAVSAVSAHRSPTDRCCLLFVIGLVVLMSGGCAIHPTTTASTPTEFDLINRFKGTVNISVSGGKTDTLALMGPKISNETFATSLKKSIEQSQLFEAVGNGDDSDYLLDIHIQTPHHIMGGLSMKSWLAVIWQLTSTKTGEVIWKDTIDSEYKTTFGDSFSGMARARKTVEGLIRVNIQVGIQVISSLTL